jgi:hypothetical protein
VKTAFREAFQPGHVGDRAIGSTGGQEMRLFGPAMANPGELVRKRD